MFATSSGVPPRRRGILGQSSRHVRDNEARGNRVSTDAARTQFLSDRLGERNHTCLGRGIVALSGVAVNTNHRRHVDDAAGALLHHDRRASVDEVESRLEVHVQDGVPLAFAHTHHQAVFRDAGIVYQDVDTAEILHDFSDDVVCFLEIRSIRGITLGFHAQRFQFSLGSQTVFVDFQIGKSDVSPFGRQFQSHSLANTTGSARYDGHFTF